MPIKQESAQTLVVLPSYKESTLGKNLRDEVRRLAMRFFFSNARSLPDPVEECSGVALAASVIEDQLPYMVLGCKYALLFFGNDVQMFYVSSDNQCVGLRGYNPLLVPRDTPRHRLYLVTVTDEDVGTFTEAYYRTSQVSQ